METNVTSQMSHNIANTNTNFQPVTTPYTIPNQSQNEYTNFQPITVTYPFPTQSQNQYTNFQPITLPPESLLKMTPTQLTNLRTILDQALLALSTGQIDEQGRSNLSQLTLVLPTVTATQIPIYTGNLSFNSDTSSLRNIPGQRPEQQETMDSDEDRDN